MYQCRLWLNGQSVGEVRWSLGETRVSVWAECPFEERVIYRVTIYGEGEDGLSIGVMAPEGGRFFVHREFPLHKARLLLKTPAYALHGEISRTLPGETRTLPLPFAFSSMGGLPADFGGRRDPLLCTCAQQVPRLRYKLFEGCEYLVFPLQVGGRMDFTAFFCLVTPVWLEGALYGVLCVDREGEARRFVPAV